MATKKTGKKRRGLTRVEMQEIERRARAGEPHDEIATALDRPVHVVTKTVARIFASGGSGGPAAPPAPLDPAPPRGFAPSGRLRAMDALYASPKYQLVKKQLLPGELQFYEDQYAALVEQFNGDVTATEVMSIHNLLELMVQMSRNTAAQRVAVETAEEAMKEARRLERKYPDDDSDPLLARPDKYQARIDAQWEQHRAALRRNDELVEKYAAMSREQRQLFDQLKSTRNQRLERATKVSSIQDLLKELTREENAEREGQRAELLRRSADREATRLAAPNTFADGGVEPCLLTPEVAAASRRPAAARDATAETVVAAAAAEEEHDYVI